MEPLRRAEAAKRWKQRKIALMNELRTAPRLQIALLQTRSGTGDGSELGLAAVQPITSERAHLTVSADVHPDSGTYRVLLSRQIESCAGLSSPDLLAIDNEASEGAFAKLGEARVDASGHIQYEGEIDAPPPPERGLQGHGIVLVNAPATWILCGGFTDLGGETAKPIP